MGVELGKVLAKNILSQLNKPEDVRGHDSSVSDLRSRKERFHRRGTLHIDDWPHPLLPEVQKGMISYSRSRPVYVKRRIKRKNSCTSRWYER
jgi:Phosphoglucose isomerase